MRSLLIAFELMDWFSLRWVQFGGETIQLCSAVGGQGYFMSTVRAITIQNVLRLGVFCSRYIARQESIAREYSFYYSCISRSSKFEPNQRLVSIHPSRT